MVGGLMVRPTRRTTRRVHCVQHHVDVLARFCYVFSNYDLIYATNTSYGVGMPQVKFTYKMVDGDQVLGIDTNTHHEIGLCSFLWCQGMFC
ncbi:hypothetical protein Hanom_Chr17g01591341 [Helianthus anomalus]